MPRTRVVGCERCTLERQARIALTGDRARLQWALKRARNRLLQLAQESAALAASVEHELMRTEV